MVDTVYEPSRIFCNKTLKRLNIGTSYYRTDTARGIEQLIQPNTKVIFIESPGSLTFEIQDIEAITKIARKHNITCIMDNTWATSVNYPAIAKGINISIQAATKYIGGHSDLMMGIITTDEESWAKVRKTYIELGHAPGTEETMLALRGLRTLPCRLKQHGQSALQIANWLENREEVTAVYFPALASHPDHALFTKQFRASSGLFSFLLQTDKHAAVCAMIDGLTLFSIGVSWGGFESLVLPVNPKPIRTAAPWQKSGQLIRLSIGLEHPDDLIKDLSSGFERLNNALHS